MRIVEVCMKRGRMRVLEGDEKEERLCVCKRRKGFYFIFKIRFYLDGEGKSEGESWRWGDKRQETSREGEIGVGQAPQDGNGSREGRDRPEQKGDVNSLGTSSPAFVASKMVGGSFSSGTKNAMGCNPPGIRAKASAGMAAITGNYDIREQELVSFLVKRSLSLGASSILFCDVFGALLPALICVWFSVAHRALAWSLGGDRNKERKDEKAAKTTRKEKKLAFVSKRIGC